MIHPNSNFKAFWNVVLTFLLLYTASFMPYKICFIENSKEWLFWDIAIDFLFTTDLMVNLISSYYTEGVLERSRLKIAYNYVKGWMLFDLIACIPIDLIQMLIIQGSSDSEYKELMRLARLPRLYRLLRIARFIKLLKYASQSELQQKIQDYLQVNHGLVRLAVFILSTLIIVHFTGCIWYFQAKLQEFNPDTWVNVYGL